MALGFLLSPYFLLNLVLGIALIEYALHKTRGPRKVVEERDSKYPAFRRTDVQYWTRARLYRAAPYIFPRIIISIILPIIYVLIVKITLIGNKRGEPNPVWKTKIFKYTAIWFSRAAGMVAAGLFKITHERVKVDYSKYLGPDWQPTYTGASTYVSNHSCWLDILICNITKDFPIYTAKTGIKNWPLVGIIAERACETYFIDRAGTKEAREKVVVDLANR